MVNKVVIVFLSIICVMMSMCEYKQQAIGSSEVIYVFANDSTREIVGQAIDTTFSYGFRSPEFIKYFNAIWKPLDSFPDLTQFKNHIIIADLNQDDFATNLVKRILPKEKYQQAEKDSISIYAIEDTWANGQMFVIIAGKNLEKMKRNILVQKSWIYQKFNDKFIKSEKAELFAKNEQKKLTRTLWKKYHWTMRIQHDYMIIHEYPKQKFVWLGRGYPYRWVSVSWENGMKTEWLTANGLFDKRNEIGKFYQNIVTDKRFLGTYFTKLGKWDALRMSGLWYHSQKTMGGPFITYAFYDFDADRTFVIDILVYALGMYNSILLRQVEIMVNTFTTNFTEDLFKS